MILVTGGAGYIGSHMVVELIEAGHEVMVIDNFSNSKPAVLDRIARISGRKPSFEKLDIRDQSGLQNLFARHTFSAVMHFAGLKAVGESVSMPQHYYNHNVLGSLVLFNTMAEFGVFKCVFSSSATVYGDPATVPIHEHFPLSATNPYGRTKLMIEEILRDLAQANAQWRIAILRYFNPVGAHASGLIGEDPNGLPNNLMPFLTQVAAKKIPQLAIFGDDYPTPDGTGIRDYIHVVDLVEGHLAALHYLKEHAGILTLNLGTGIGYSVLDLVTTFSEVNQISLPYRVTARRLGDIAQCYSDTSLANRTLGWKAKRTLAQMCKDAWVWQTNSVRLDD